MLRPSKTKQENDGWEEKWPKAATLSCFEKKLFQEIRKTFKTSEEIQISRKKKASLLCLDNLVSRACYLFVSIPFLSPSNIRLATCPGDEVGVSSISWNRSKLRFSTFVLAHPETFFFFFVFSAGKLNFRVTQTKEILPFWNSIFPW